MSMVVVSFPTATGDMRTSYLLRSFYPLSEVGVRLQAQGLFDHGRRRHGFLNGLEINCLLTRVLELIIIPGIAFAN